MHEAGIELSVHAELPELDPVLPVEMSVAAEHLLEHVLHFMLEALRETGGLAAPVVRVLLLLFGLWQWWSACEGVAGEESRVLDLTADPGLDVLDVSGCWEVDWVAFRVDPGVGGSSETCQWISSRTSRVYCELTVQLSLQDNSAHCTVAVLSCDPSLACT